MFACSKCSTEFPQFAKNCPSCGGFNTLSMVGGDEEPANLSSWIETDDRVVALSEVDARPLPRISTNTREFDRVLGGGLVVGSTVLIGGDPGIGKSTLVLQTARDLTTAVATDEEGKPDGVTVLYVSAEETKSQIKDRATRLSSNVGSERLLMLSANDVEVIAAAIEEHRPDVLIVDSIQTMMKKGVMGAAGSVVQVKECAQFLVNVCRASAVGCFMIAHVTKGGDLAGPKTLEHLVDAVLEFSKEGNAGLRCLRAAKNRFGSIEEMGLFKMTGTGLHSVENPSELLLEEHVEGVSGVAIAVACEGSRPMAVEVQTLARKARFTETETGERKMAAKQIISGVSKDRVAMMLAVLEERCGIEVEGDLYVSVAGGVRLAGETGADLGIAISIASSVTGTTLPEGVALMGEVGLAGEVRLVSHLEARLKAARLLGFETIFGPELPTVEDADGNELPNPLSGEDYFGVGNLPEVLEALGVGSVGGVKARAKKKRPRPRKVKEVA